MPKISDYLRLAPFAVDELVDAANSVLRDRPALQVSKRTVRYYVSERILPPPGGSPKFARYGTEHLVRLVAARALGDAGRSLGAIRVELDRLLAQGDEAAVQAQEILDGPSSVSASAFAIPPSSSGLVRRIPLGRLVIEAPGEMDERTALDEARALLELRSQ